MKRVFITLLLFFMLYVPAFSQNKSCDVFSNIDESLHYAIDTLKKISPDSGTFNVYVVVVDKYDQENNSISYLISYIFNSNQFLPTYTTSYFMFDDEYVLVRFQDTVSHKCLKSIGLQLINSENSVSMVQKLYPSVIGAIHATHKGFIFSTSMTEQKRIYFNECAELDGPLSLYYKDNIREYRREPILLDD